jgi:7,8-dihydropterin-6-yl-methyl-4-(beta-D-ribofuranosyl)aminobenzene 5'-phosphate synthase
MKKLEPNALDRVEILTLQDNYIEMTAMDNTPIVTRAVSLKDGMMRNSVLSEHGFSALITTGRAGAAHTMLFDFGFSEEGAAYNARVLGADLSKVEAAALSHGHGDHMGGFEKLAALIGKKGIEFVAHPVAFHSPRYLKFSEEFKVHFPQYSRGAIEEAGMTVVETTTPYAMLGGDVLYLGEIPRKTDFEKGFPIAYRQEGGKERWDPIEDDTSVVMNLKSKGLLILSGCAHSGIINTVRHAREVTGIEKVHAVMGGFHLSGPLFEGIVNPTIEELKKIGPDYIVPTHCTGRKAVMAIERAMPENFILNMSGTRLTFTG